jgi:hypothetical protein
MKQSRLAQLLRLPPRQAAAKVRKHLATRWAARRMRRHDRRAPSYVSEVPAGELARFFQVPAPALLHALAAPLQVVTDLYLAHKFDLLGSGWVEVRHGMRCGGLHGRRYDAAPAGSPTDRITPANRDMAAAAAALLSETYRPIDWHIDFKSGYRWREDCWYLDVPYGHQPGVDIKLPWELARMQHLAHLAWAYVLAGAGTPGFRPPTVYVRESRDQVLDFIAHNPPRFGVNWRCTMDVAIRAANWLVWHDLMRAAGAEFDTEFDARFKSSLLDHGRHIMANLEWDAQHRGNHYLANVAGLLFIAAYLPETQETAGWFTFAAAELEREVAFQFHADGTNFEASTCYHRLSTEMALYATALAGGATDGPAFSDAHYDRLREALRFTAWITKPSGQALQIGDNDSGRFFKLAPVFESSPGESGPAENHLDHRHLIGAGLGLFGPALLAGVPAVTESPALALEREITAGFGIATPADKTSHEHAGPVARAEAPPGRCLGHWRILAPGKPLATGLRIAAFPDFGLYVYRSERLFLTVRCGSIGMNGRGPHAHNDQLAVELAIDGEDWIRDPGSYLYTPLPDVRNAYRSAMAHFAPRLGDREPGALDLGLFYLGDQARAQCDSFTAEGFLGHHHGFGIPVYRRLRIDGEAVEILDVLSDGTPGATTAPAVLEGRQAVCRSLQPAIAYSPGYGIRHDAGDGG